jgi:hypothetical protein
VKKFKTLRKQEQVEIEDDLGVVRIHTVREMSAGEIGKWNTELRTRFALNQNNEAVELKNLDGMMESLLSRCLFDSDGKLVTKEVIASWASETVQALYDIASALNRPNKAEQDAEKKD